MPVIFKKRGDTPPAPSAPSASPVATPAPTAPKKVLKIGGGANVTKPAEAPPIPQASPPNVHAAKSFAVPDQAPRKYEQVCLGDKVVITNSMFPWVKHYKPGDVGVVTRISETPDPLGISTDGSHHTHVIRIDYPKDPSRKGQTAALFRWEFELYKAQPSEDEPPASVVHSL